MDKNSKLYKILIKYFPIIEWIQKYKISFLKNDIIAGLSVGLTLIPQGLAYGSVAGLKPQYGLFSAFWGPFLYFIFGTSRDITIGPTAILSILVAHYSIQSGISYDCTYSVALCLLAGCIQLVLGLFSLGFIANYMSPTVVSGFTSSAAILIAWGQMKSFLGLSDIRSNFFLSVYDIFSSIRETNLPDMVCGVCCLVVLILFKILFIFLNKLNTDELSPFKRTIKKIVWFICICSNISVIIVSTIVSYYMENWEFGTLTITGKIHSGLPIFEVPKFQIKNGSTVVKSTVQLFRDIGTGIPIVALIALVEAMAIGKAFARQNGYKIRSSQEFIAIGVSNFVGSFFLSMPVTGSFSRTAINSQCGSKSTFSGVITGTLVILALRFLTPYFEYIPIAALSAIIIVAVIFMTDFKYLYRTWFIKKYDCLTWVITFVISLAMGVEYGVIIGIGFSFLPIVFVASRPKFEIKSNVAQFKGSFLWFPFISKLAAMIDATDLEHNNKVFLDLTGVYSADSAVINTLLEIGQEFKARRKVLVIILNHPKIAHLLQYDKSKESGLKCYRTYEESVQYYPDLADSYINERTPLV